MHKTPRWAGRELTFTTAWTAWGAAQRLPMTAREYHAVRIFARGEPAVGDGRGRKRHGMHPRCAGPGADGGRPRPCGAV